MHRHCADLSVLYFAQICPQTANHFLCTVPCLNRYILIYNHNHEIVDILKFVTRLLYRIISEQNLEFEYLIA